MVRALRPRLTSRGVSLEDLPPPASVARRHVDGCRPCACRRRRLRDRQRAERANERHPGLPQQEHRGLARARGRQQLSHGRSLALLGRARPGGPRGTGGCSWSRRRHRCNGRERAGRPARRDRRDRGRGRGRDAGCRRCRRRGRFGGSRRNVGLRRAAVEPLLDERLRRLRAGCVPRRDLQRRRGRGGRGRCRRRKGRDRRIGPPGTRRRDGPAGACRPAGRTGREWQGREERHRRHERH